MRLTIFLTFLFFYSCTSERTSERTSESTLEVSCIILINENNKYNSYLIENIEQKILKDNNDYKLFKYDSLTSEYLKYLEKLELEIKESTTEVFFDGEDYSQIGREYIQKTNKYRLEIEKLLISNNQKKRINLILNTNDVILSTDGSEVAKNNETAEYVSGKVYLKYLNYYFQDFSNNQALAFLSNKKRGVLEIENEVVENRSNLSRTE